MTGLKAIMWKEKVSMNKERLEWIISGLKKHTLTKYEDHFLKAALEDFEKNGLTEQQEERLERLYKEKSQLTPRRGVDYFSFKESAPKKRPQRPRPKE